MKREIVVCKKRGGSEVANRHEFKYHPNPIETGAFKEGETAVCDSCGKGTKIYYTGPFYAVEEISALCPFCILSGDAAEKFDGLFQDSYSIERGHPSDLSSFDNEDAIKEVTTKTPGYQSWQQGVWLSHCNDLCAFIGYVGWDNIKDKLDGFVDLEADIGGTENMAYIKNNLVNGGSMQGYLFQCLHCKKYRLHLDYD